MSDYDAIVIGGGIAGYGIAGPMQRRSTKTLLLEK